MESMCGERREGSGARRGATRRAGAYDIVELDAELEAKLIELFLGCPTSALVRVRKHERRGGKQEKRQRTAAHRQRTVSLANGFEQQVTLYTDNRHPAPYEANGQSNCFPSWCAWKRTPPPAVLSH